MIDKLKWVCGEGRCFQIGFRLSNSETVFIYKFLNSNLNCLHRIGLNVKEMNSNRNSSLDLFLVCIQKNALRNEGGLAIKSLNRLLLLSIRRGQKQCQMLPRDSDNIEREREHFKSIHTVD